MDNKVIGNRTRNSQQEIGIKKLEELNGPKSSLKKNKKKKDRYSLMLDKPLKIRKEKSIEKKNKKISIDESNIKTNGRIMDNNKSPPKKKQKTVQILEEKNAKKENSKWESWLRFKTNSSNDIR